MYQDRPSEILYHAGTKKIMMIAWKIDGSPGRRLPGQPTTIGFDEHTGEAKYLLFESVESRSGSIQNPSFVERNPETGELYDEDGNVIDFEWPEIELPENIPRSAPVGLVSLGI